MNEQGSTSAADDFDFDLSTDQAWQVFTERLAEVVSVVEQGEPLTIGTDPDGDDPAPWVRFSADARTSRDQQVQVFVEASGNASLGDDYQLDLPHLDTLGSLGWQPPTLDGPHPTQNFWVRGPQDDALALAELSVRTLREVFGVVHPVFLAPDHLAEVLTPAPEVLEAPNTRPALLDEHDAVATMPRNRAQLDELVELELTHMFGHTPIRDNEGDIAIRVGSSVVFVRTSTDADEVLIFSPLVHEVEGRSRAVEVLNDLNAESRHGRFALVRDRVFVSVSLLARPFVPAHLHEGVRVMSALADAIDDELAAKLKGRVSFSDHE